MPLAEIVLLPSSVTPADVHRAVVQHGHPRYVITDYDGAPAGYLHMKDVMEIHGNAFHEPVPAKRIRRLIAVPRDADVEDGLTRLRQHGVHIARTVDENGTTVGLLFLEDVLEVLVGEVNDATAA